MIQGDKNHPKPVGAPGGLEGIRNKLYVSLKQTLRRF